ncbi:MAG TPA: immunoglobulin domain-containing protein, partial [Bacillota bacterium]|nr:immunoglobulin domain-containing protein [Bacillota bacterium]
IATLTVITAPMITTQPQNQTVMVGQNATFSLNATGATPMSYFWCFKGVNIPGATASSYIRTNVQTSDAGTYSVIVSNALGNVTSADAVLSVIPAQSGTVIAQWDFNSLPADGSTTTGTTTPSIGSGTASLVGGTTQTFASGSTNDPAASGSDNSGWNTASYPAQGSGNKTAGVQFNVSTLGRENITLRWDQKESNTGSKYVRLQYSTNGTTFVDVPSATAVAATGFEAKTNSLSGIPGVADNATFAFRIVAEFESTATGAGSASYVGAGGTYGSGGTIRFDLVTVSGTAISVTPPAPASLSGFIYSTNGPFQLALTGTTGAKYVIQAATDLSLGNWVSLLTNAAPFMFSDTNAGSATCRFYRAVTLP